MPIHTEAHPHAERTAMTRQSPARPAHRSWGVNCEHHVIMAVIGLALAERLARDSRTYEHVIMAVIGLAAVAGLARASQARSFARLAAWDKRQNLSRQPVSRARRA
jgi:hypothetical protein